MMTAMTNTGEVKPVWETKKADAPFTCPECGGGMLMVTGLIKTHHFRHRPEAQCEYSGGETQEHLRVKKSIWESYRSEGAKIEHSLGYARPDVYFEKNGLRFAIEVQRSTLDLKTVMRRTGRYDEDSVVVIWITLGKTKDKDKRYAPKSWERYAEKRGQLFEWDEGFEWFNEILFKPYTLYKEEWNGYGGYAYKSKRYVTRDFVECDVVLDERFKNDPLYKKYQPQDFEIA